MNLFSQGIPLGRWFGTRVVLGFTHLIVLYILVEDIPDRTMAVIAAISLFISVLLHEFGHAFACKGVGGTADLIILGPMGGQTTTRAPSFPIPQFVITAVPNPEATLDEFVRVTKPDGEIILVNHIGAESGPRWLFEQCFAPLARQLGWRPEFPFARLTDWARRHGAVRLVERRPIRPLGHFSLVRFSRTVA